MPTAPSDIQKDRSVAPAVLSAEQLADNPHADAEKAERVERMFAAIASRYDLNNRLHSFGRDQAWRRAAVAMCGVQPTDDVLDVACGTGDLAEHFASAGARSVTGVDFTQPMLDLAAVKAKRCRRSEGAPAPVYEHGDAMRLRFHDGSFDIVSIAFGIRNVSDPARALAEFHRVLRPRGRLLVLEFSTPRNPLIRWGNAIYCKRIMPMTATLIARDRSGAYKYLPRSIETFLDTEQMRAAIEAAGFTSVRARPMTFGVCTAHLAQHP